MRRAAATTSSAESRASRIQSLTRRLQVRAAPIRAAMIVAAAAAANAARKLAQARRVQRMPHLVEEVRDGTSKVSTVSNAVREYTTLIARQASGLAAAGWEPSPQDPFIHG